jgi:RimJ/RimL family protein N-acetyltransferase
VAGDTVIETARLLLRRWRPEDLEPFAAMNADPEVMRHFPAVLSRAESDAIAARMIENLERRGYGWWVAGIKETGAFAGCIALSVPSFEAHFTPCVEIGWRLAREHWRRGYAVEGATAVLRHGFTVVGLDEIVSFTIPANERSWQVMQRIGMHRDPADDFDHPSLPEGHRVRRHLLYRLTREEWKRAAAI